MEVHILAYLAILLIAALIGSKLAKKLHLPNVTGYLMMGILVGPHCLKLIPVGVLDGLGLISDMALGFIAFSIGAEFHIGYLKKMGKSPIVIAVFEACTATLLVDLVLLVLGYDLTLALSVGAIASATAAASTLMIVKQYKAKGPVTSTLLPVVAMDDAVALMAFGISMAVVKIVGTGEFSVSAVGGPLLEIFGALAFGAVLGVLLALLVRLYTGRGNRLAVTIAMIFLCVGVSDMLGLSSLLACMMMSAVFANLSKEADKIFEPLDRMTPPIYMMFFIVSGASLDITLIPKIGVIGIVYVVFRVAGKALGAGIGAAISKAPAPVRRYLGWTLIPQEGVAIGLVTVARSQLPKYGNTIQTVILCGIVIFELLGPMITKMTLKRAEEI